MMRVVRYTVLPGLLVLWLLAGCSDDGTSAKADASPEGGSLDGSRDSSHDGAPPVPEKCPGEALVPPASGTCKVTKGTTTAVLLRGTVVLPERVVENGQLLIDKGKIVCAGCECAKSSAASGATVVECAQGVISPSLINPHDHLGWTTLPPKTTATRYGHRHEWRKGKNQMPKITVGGSDYRSEAVSWGELRMLMGGTTSMLGEGGSDKLVRNLEKDNEGLGKPAVVNDTFPLGDNDGEMLAEQCTYPTIPKAATVQKAMAWVPHVAEGVIREARNEFLCLSGQQAGGVDTTLPNVFYIHSVGLTAADVLDMARGGTGVVWSPRSNVSLYGFTANVVMMDHLGLPIALGTDWTPSGSMNMLRELACADYLNQTHYGKYFSDKQLYEMATVNGAKSAGVADVLGSLKAGQFADVAIWNGAKRSGYGAVIRAEAADVVLVMRGGEVIYGDDQLVSGLGGESCETTDVCGVAKRLCLQREIGKTLTELKSAVGSPYALFFCGVPADEPTCVPSRPNEYDGKVTAADSDGDGVPNDKDTCPTVFNPPRAIEGMKQPDTDGDKLGDECDVCPLDANTTTCSSSPNPKDKDGDGVEDAQDNCPLVPNKDQKDTDGDKIGDLCDNCPKANPGGAACPFTIRELRDISLGLRPADGTLVKISKATVTAVRTTKAGNYGFYLREGKNPFEAIFVFTKAAVPVDETKAELKPGDLISLEGPLARFSSTDEIDSPTKVQVSGSGDISPIEVKTATLQPGSASAEGLESHLVRVSSVQVAAMVSAGTSDAFWVSDDGSACSGTTPACSKVGDYYYDGGTVNGQPAAAAGQKFSSITGVVNGYKDEHSLEPRAAADLVP